MLFDFQDDLAIINVSEIKYEYESLHDDVLSFTQSISL